VEVVVEVFMVVAVAELADCCLAQQLLLQALLTHLLLVVVEVQELQLGQTLQVLA
jgi:hypothetical protein